MSINSERPPAITEFNNILIAIGLFFLTASMWIAASLTKSHLKIEISYKTKGIWE